MRELFQNVEYFFVTQMKYILMIIFAFNDLINNVGLTLMLLRAYV